MISKIHPILLIDPPHREASVKGRDARIVVGTQASGSCLRYGLEVRAAHRYCLQSQKPALWRRKKYAACLQCYFFPLLVICFISSLASLSPHHSCAIMSAQICQLVGLVNHIHHTSVQEKGRRGRELGKQHYIVLQTGTLSACCCQGLLIAPEKQPQHCVHYMERVLSACTASTNIFKKKIGKSKTQIHLIKF